MTVLRYELDNGKVVVGRLPERYKTSWNEEFFELEHVMVIDKGKYTYRNDITVWYADIVSETIVQK